MVAGGGCGSRGRCSETETVGPVRKDIRGEGAFNMKAWAPGHRGGVVGGEGGTANSGGGGGVAAGVAAGPWGTAQQGGGGESRGRAPGWKEI